MFKVTLHTEAHFVSDPHMEHVETDSMWRVIYGTFKDTLHTEAHFVSDPHMEHVETDSVWRVICISIVVRQTMTC